MPRKIKKAVNKPEPKHQEVAHDEIKRQPPHLIQETLDPNRLLAEFLQQTGIKIVFTRTEPGTYFVNGSFIVIENPQLGYRGVYEAKRSN